MDALLRRSFWNGNVASLPVGKARRGYKRMTEIHALFQSHGLCASDRARDSWEAILDFYPVAKERVRDISSQERLLLASEVCEFFNCLEVGAGRIDETVHFFQHCYGNISNPSSMTLPIQCPRISASLVSFLSRTPYS